MKLFPAAGTLDFVAMDILGPFNLTAGGHEFYTDDQFDAENEEVAENHRDGHHDEEEIEDEFR